uniref:Uncharacterized protein n=1 Tax=Anguilla anguilla TaxID=7936 RepID=A0A0E9TD56_ANGAN
MGTAHRAEVEV